MAPHSGTLIPTGVVGSNVYTASYGTDPAQPQSGQTPILQLVTSDPEGDINITGSVARLGQDYLINQNFSENAPPVPVLDAVGGDAGNVRIGTSGSLSASAENVGDGALSGTFPGASGEFSGGPAAFGPLAGGESASQVLQLHPVGSPPR